MSHARRPWLLRWLPLRLRLSLFARHYRKRAPQHLSLYAQAPLHFAPQVHMRGLQPGDVISDYLAFTGVYELHTTRQVMALGRRGGVMIDIGANMGYFSLLFAHAHPDNEVHAFEASPRVAALLRANIAAAGFTDRIHVHECAVAEQAGSLNFDPGPAAQTGWGGIDPAGSVQVPARRVDACVRTDRPIRLLKIDIEGADTWALRSCAGLFDAGLVEEVRYEQHRPRMQALGIAADAARHWLQSRHFDLQPQGNPDRDVVDWIATRRPPHF